MIIFFPEPFELARHSSTSSNECIDHGAGNRPTFESELEEYEEPINQETTEKLPKGAKISSEESTFGLAEENENDRKRYSSSIHSKGIFKSRLGFFKLGFLKDCTNLQKFTKISEIYVFRR